MINKKGTIRSYTSVNGSYHEFDFQFNPTTVSEDRGVKYNFSEAQGQILPLAQYGRVEPTSLSFSLFGYSNEGDQSYLHNIRKLTLPRSLSLTAPYEQVAPHVYILDLGEYGVWTGVFQTVSIQLQRYSKKTLKAQQFTADIVFVGVSVDDAIDMVRIGSRTGLSRNSGLRRAVFIPAPIETIIVQGVETDAPAQISTTTSNEFLGIAGP